LPNNGQREGIEVTTKISREEVRHVAKLSRLDFTQQQEERLTDQMNSLLAYMDTLNQLDTTGVVPMTHAIHLENVFRADEVHTSLDQEHSLANAPASDGASFIVPKII
jgi:aspartyl-tRNA(Asn)/glutamyl-tRNA(Gln) amidotransferase subunit C